MQNANSNRRKTLVQVVAFTLSLATVNAAPAHDIWLHAERFSLGKGDTLIVHQLVGTELDTEDDLALSRMLTSRFALITPQGTVDLLSELPDMRTQPEIKPVLKRKLDFDGLALVTMDHAFIWDEWPREEFLENLEHEEFDIEAFEPHMGRGPMESERYRRTLKALVQVGSVTEGDLHKRVVGQRLEILLLQNPYLLDPGDDIEVQVLFDGEPLHDKLVKAFHKTGRGVVTKSRARTSQDGIARFTLDEAGPWLIRLVHMLPCAERADVDCEDVYWESHWASYSFALN